VIRTTARLAADYRPTSWLAIGTSDGLWLPVNSGEEPNRSNVTGSNTVADGIDGGPSKLLVDGLRRIESATIARQP